MDSGERPLVLPDPDVVTSSCSDLDHTASLTSNFLNSAIDSARTVEVAAEHSKIDKVNRSTTDADLLIDPTQDAHGIGLHTRPKEVQIQQTHSVSSLKRQSTFSPRMSKRRASAFVGGGSVHKLDRSDGFDGPVERLSLIQKVFVQGIGDDDNSDVVAQKAVAVYTSIAISTASFLYGIYSATPWGDRNYGLANAMWSFGLVAVLSGLLVVYCVKQRHEPLVFAFMLGALLFPLVHSLSHGCQSVILNGGSMFMFVVPSSGVSLLAGASSILVKVVLFWHFTILVTVSAFEYGVHKGTFPCPSSVYGAFLGDIEPHLVGTVILIVLGLTTALLCILFFKAAVDQKTLIMDEAFELASQLAHCISRMDLQQAKKFATDEPSPLEVSLFDIVANLEQFRPYLPDALWHINDEISPRHAPSTSSSSVEDLARRPSILSMDGGLLMTKKLNRSIRSAKQDATMTLNDGLLEWRPVSILMIDMKDFHQLVSQHKKTTLIVAAFIQEFLSVVVKVTKEHKGTIGLFEGHRIWCVWNGAGRLSSHLHHAFHAAVQIRDGLRGTVSAHMVLWTDTLLVGTAGTATMKQFLSLGRARTLCSKLGNLADKLQVSILTCFEFFQQFDQQHDIRELDVVTFNSDAMVVYQVMESRKVKDDQSGEWMYALAERQDVSQKQFSDGFRRYCDGSYEEGAACFRAFLEQRPADLQASRLLALCEAPKEAAAIKDITHCVHLQPVECSVLAERAVQPPTLDNAPTVGTPYSSAPSSPLLGPTSPKGARSKAKNAMAALRFLTLEPSESSKSSHPRRGKRDPSIHSDVASSFLRASHLSQVSQSSQGHPSSRTATSTVTDCTWTTKGSRHSVYSQNAGNTATPTHTATSNSFKRSPREELSRTRPTSDVTYSYTRPTPNTNPPYSHVLEDDVEALSPSADIPDMMVQTPTQQLIGVPPAAPTYTPFIPHVANTPGPRVSPSFPSNDDVKAKPPGRSFMWSSPSKDFDSD
eukprot:NODE_86_length_3408_cov_75.934855_g81_i0.p1 GENE.NODE_86_length_3408_cov_75.934855_g81_i0~~NODE_86_length_3408_cov_75.934855_g81_i0.p1  ORF type:complete len:1012 (+),score=144.83 NODE_86_length_3408_cov_75.934855_g81_i0:64-3036(+)